MRISAAASSVILALLCAGCVSQESDHTRMITAARGVTNPAGVRIYSVAPKKRFTEIAFIEGRTPEEMRARAAAVGANGVILGEVTRRPGPVIGLGFGTGSGSYSRHGSSYFGTDAAFAIPTGKSVVQGTAIYVP